MKLKGRHRATFARRYSILSFVQAYTDLRGYAPTHAEIAEAIGVNPSSVARHLDTLQQSGRIRRERNVPRSVEVVT